MKVHFRFVVLIFLFLILNTFAYSDLIVAKTTSEATVRPATNEIWIVSSSGYQHFLTPSLTSMMIHGLTCNDRSSNIITLLHSSDEVFSAKPISGGMIEHIEASELQYKIDSHQGKPRNRLEWPTSGLSCLTSNIRENSKNFNLENVGAILSNRLPYLIHSPEIGPNIGALTAVGTDGSILNGSITRPESNISRNTYYDVRGVNIGALAAVAADKAIMEATITQLNGSAVTIQIAKNSVQHGGNQSITVTVTDKLTKKVLQNASIDGWISDSSGISTVFLSGLTNSSGVLSGSWHVTNTTAPGKATVVVEAYHRGYQRSAKSASFLVTP